MSLLAWLRRLANPTPRKAARTARGPRRRWDRALPRLEALEDRLAPATTINIVPGAAGTQNLDAVFLNNNGTISPNDFAGTTQGLSFGALTSLGPSDINITAQSRIDFKDFGSSGTLSLPQVAGHTVTFQTLTTGSTISFDTLGNTLSTAGADFTFRAGTDLSTINLVINNSTAASVLTLSAGLQGNNTGNLNLGGAANAGLGKVVLSASNSIRNPGSPTNVVGATVSMAARAGIGTSASPINTSVDAVAAQTLTGDLFVSNVGDVTVGFTGEPVNAVGFQSTGAAGNVSLASTGSVFVTRNKDVIKGPSSVTVTTTGIGSNIVTGGNNVGAGAAVLSSGPVTLNAGGSLLFGDTSTIPGAPGDVQSGGAISLSAGRDIVLDEGSVVNSTGAGSVTATAGNNLAMVVGNIALRHTSKAGASIVTHGGAVSLATSAAGAFTLDSGAGGRLDTTLGAGLPGSVSVAADFMTFNDPINAGTAFVQLQPVTPSEVINLGSKADPTQLGLVSSDFAQITAAVVRVGNASNTGGIVLGGTITQGSGYNTLSLITGGEIQEGINPDGTTAGLLAVTNLAFRAGSGIDVRGTSAGSVLTAASNLAWINTGPNGRVHIANNSTGPDGPLTINAVDGITACSNNGLDTVVGDGGPLVVAIDVTGQGGVGLTASSLANPSTADLTVNSGITIQATLPGSGVTLAADHNVFVPVTATIIGDQDFIDAGLNYPNSGASISMLGTERATTRVLMTADGDITLGTVTILAGSPLVPAGTLSLTSNNGNIRDDGNETTLLTAQTYNFTAAKAIGADTPISRNDVLLADAAFQAALDLAPSVNSSGQGTATINISQTGAGGNVQLRDTDGRFDTRMLGTLALKGTGSSQFAMIASGVLVQGSNFAGDLVVDSTLTLTAAANDNLLLAATNGNNVQVGNASPVTNNGPTGAVTLVAAAGKVTTVSGITAKGAVNLTSAGNSSGFGVTVSAAVTTSGGGISVDSNKDVTLGAALSTTGASGGPISVIAAESLAGSISAGTGAVLMNGTSSLNTSSSNSAITAQAGGAPGQGGNVTLRGVNAGTGPVTVTSFVGNIVDGNGPANNVTGGAISLTANGFTGIDLDLVTATPATAGVTATAPNGAISLRSVSALQVNSVAAGAAASVSANSLTSLHPNDNVADVAGTTVTLSTNGPIGSSVNNVPQFFEVSAQTLTATTVNSPLWVSALGGAALANVSAGTDMVTLQGVNGSLTSTHAGTTTPDVTAGTVAVLLATGPGASLGSLNAPLLVNAGTLNAQVTNSTGSLNVIGVAGDLTVVEAHTAGGAVTIGDSGHTLTVGNPAVPGQAVIGGAGAAVSIIADTVASLNAGGGAPPDVQAATFSLQAKFDVGTASNPLQVLVGTFNAQGRDVFVNSQGPLTYAPIAGANFPFALSGGLFVTSAGTQTVSEPIVTVGDIILQADGATSDIVVGPGQSLSAGQKIQLGVGRSVLLQSTSLIGSRTGGSVTLFVGESSQASASLIAGGFVPGNAVGYFDNNVDHGTLTVNFTAGASLPSGMTFDGGSGRGGLVYTDENGNRGHVYVLTQNAISRDGGKSAITYTNVGGVSVVGSPTNDLFVVQGTPSGAVTALRGLGGANAFYISSDAPVTLGDLSQIGGPMFIDPGSGPSNLLVVSEYGRTGADDVTLTSSTMTFTALPKPLSINYAPTGFLRGNVKLVVGGGNDIVRVLGTAALATTSLYTVGGNATISVSTAGGAANTLLGTLDIDAGTGAVQFIFSELNTLAADNLTLSANRLSSSTSGFVINFTATGGAFSRGFLVYTGAANDVVTVNGTAPGSYSYINTGASPDLVTVNVSGPDPDVLIVDGGDSGAPAGNLLSVNDVAGGATAFRGGPGSGVVRFSYPAGLRDVYYFSMDQVFTNPAAG